MYCRYIIVILLFILTSCAGYHFRSEDNPLKDFEIQSISVPMFYNRSTVANFTPYLTKEFILMLNRYPGLKVVSGSQPADAVLVGILYSGQYLRDTFAVRDATLTTGKLKESIGERQAISVPYRINYNLHLKVFLIKHPTSEELKLLTSEFAEQLPPTSKIIISNDIPVHSLFANVIYPNLTKAGGVATNNSGELNMTKNKGIADRQYQEHAKSTAQYFKEIVLNAF